MDYPTFGPAEAKLGYEQTQADPVAFVEYVEQEIETVHKQSRDKLFFCPVAITDEVVRILNGKGWDAKKHVWEYAGGQFTISGILVTWA